MAGIYSKVVSTTRQIDSIHTFIGGVKKDIDSVFVFVNGERKQVFPSSEIYTKVFANTTGGAYSTSLGYGRYKIVISGGGGSGSSVALRKTGSVSNRIQNPGNAGVEKTIIIDVPYGATWTFSGIVGTGGKGSSTNASTSSYSHVLGAAGTGYYNGSQGTTQHFFVGQDMSTGYAAMAGGSSGGTTSLSVNGTLKETAQGGAGGGATIVNTLNNQFQQPGTFTVQGGYGFMGEAFGATGGAIGYGAGSGSANTSGAGTNGYVYIYKSNIYPN